MIVPGLPEGDDFAEFHELEELIDEDGKLTTAAIAMWMLDVNLGWIEAFERLNSDDDPTQDQGAQIAMALHDWAGPKIMALAKRLSDRADADESEPRTADSA